MKTKDEIKTVLDNLARMLQEYGETCRKLGMS